ncbi:hypothetical protein H310_05846 [Aphanomyces invadans]|uniref:Transmembrane protein 198 n=1 Tax=Aphanomyces invadans TaxID=157072 RepID=A0A024U9K4_9STRA|nr:hypothetical protein H310_05846 [Aphanomyces invadans]ETW02298.1 hypothetical protein H310_05846 [Aphanomyces invadans]|eukprot:XP_008868903.1 hypothetical protein H310_05846 [Aphanomyces invadans]
MALGRLVLVGYGLLVATAQPVISNPLVLLLNSGVQAVAQRPAYILGVVSTAPPVPPVSTLVPASEDNNPVVLMLNVGIRGGSGTFKHEPNLPQLNTAAKGDPVDENNLDLLRTPQSKVHLMSGIAAALSIVSGAILAFLGFKLLRISALLCGFAVGGLTSYVLSTILFPDPSSIVLAAWLSLLVGGLLIGVICMLVEQVGNFIVGASGGMALAILMHISFNYLFWPSNPNAALYVWGASLSLVLGLLAVLVGKPLLVVATGLTGGLTFIWGIGYFAGRYPCVIALPRTQYLAGGAWHYATPSAWWGYLTASLVVAIAGIGLQWTVTGVVGATPKKPEDPHHATHKTGHRELHGPPDDHRHTRHSRRDDDIELIDTRHGRRSSTPEDDLERNPNRYGEDLEPVTTTTYVTVGTPRNMHGHHHRR